MSFDSFTTNEQILFRQFCCRKSFFKVKLIEELFLPREQRVNRLKCLNKCVIKHARFNYKEVLKNQGDQRLILKTGGFEQQNL